MILIFDENKVHRFYVFGFNDEDNPIKDCKFNDRVEAKRYVKYLLTLDNIHRAGLVDLYKVNQRILPCIDRDKILYYYAK